MKNININSLGEQTPAQYIEFFLMRQLPSKTLEKLGNPRTLNELLEKVKDILKEKEKFWHYIPLKEEILTKIIFEAISSNRTIEEQFSLFKKHHSGSIAAARVLAGNTIANFANNAYIPITPVNNSDYSWKNLLAS